MEADEAGTLKARRKSRSSPRIGGHGMTSSHYAHGTDAAEQQRLTTMNRLLNDRCLAAARLSTGDRVVDFGAGLGQVSRAMARATGIKVVGIERSEEQIRGAM